MDIHTIIAGHRPKKIDEKETVTTSSNPKNAAELTSSEIPDIFFEDILVKTKLSRIDITVLMYLYRRVWCRPNLYKTFGISPMLSLAEIAKLLHLSMDELYQAFRRLEDYGFIGTIRSGQYFVRKYFSRELDEKYGQTYDDFEV